MGINRPSQNSRLSEQYDNSVLIAIYDEFVPEKIVKDLENCENFEDFTKIREDLTSMVDSMFEEYLSNYSENIQKNFKLWKFNGFKGTEQEEKQLENLLYQKNLLFDTLMLAYIEKGGLDNVLSWKDREDIILLLESNINKLFNDLFLKWRKSYKPSPNEEDKIENKLYGAFEQGLDKTKKYSELSSKNVGEFNFYNKDIQGYINGILKLMQTTTSYKAWVENQNYENAIWSNKESTLGVVGPQEAYALGKKVIEPHLAIYLKQEFIEEKEQASKLAKKYFKKDYDVKDVKSFFVEPLLETGAMAFWKIAGESIPCDTELAKKFKININTPSRFKSRTQQGFSKLTEFIKYEANIDKIVEESKKFVVFHELGHSMFLKDTKDNRTIFEELKADLFYFLKLLDEGEKSNDEIRVIVEQIIIDAIRTSAGIENNKIELGKYEMEQYIIANSIELQTAFNTGLISWRGDSIKINTERWEAFIVNISKILSKVKELYDKWYDLDTSKEKAMEENLLSKYFNITKVWNKTYIGFDENIQKFIKLANK